jgi:para-aminobenzoate synthetase component I
LRIVAAAPSARAVERTRLEWWVGQPGDPATLLERFLAEHGLPVGDLSATARGPVGGSADEPADGVRAVVLVGAAAAARMADAPTGAASPAPDVPDLVAVIHDSAGRPTRQAAGGPLRVGPWRCTWADAEHAAAVRAVRAEIAAGEVYQVNVVGHRSAPFGGDPTAALGAAAALPGARYGGVLRAAPGTSSPPDWALASASPEALVVVENGTARTYPVKGTRPATPGGRRALLASTKERAEHIMIVDLERNDLGRLAVPGTVRVEELYALREWSGLWQAESTVAAALRPGVGLAGLLRALLPGGSVTGAPKLAAVAVAARLEPVGRGPSMGAFGVVTPGRVELGLTIRTVAAAGGRLHLWAGGGITWGSDPDAEVAEAHAKAAPILRALSG